jgi:two-component sensor histidine kinase
MWWTTRIFAWRLRQPSLIRWLEAAALFGVALAIRSSLGSFDEAARFLTFYPAILVASVLLGWQEAVFVLVLSLAAGWYFFLPPGPSLLPLGWALVGGLNIAIIAALKSLAQQLAEANDRQRVLFEELQHRVANTLQISAGKLETIRRRLNSSPGECADILDEAIRRFSGSAEMHRRLHDPGLFNNGLEAMLREVVMTTIDRASVRLDLHVEELDLSLDQKSVIAILAMEVANNSAKHVFGQKLGSRLEVALLALPGHRAILKIRDDGPGAMDAVDLAPSKQKLGVRILQGLADQLHGTLVTELDQGMKVTVNFPTSRHSRGNQRRADFRSTRKAKAWPALPQTRWR